jgi:uncharacterized protein YaiL (DUF2058 family)
MDNLVVPILVAILGAGGFGAFFREIVAGIIKVVGGMSARESSRKVDIVQQRDAALAREAKAWRLVDEEAAKRRVEQEYAARLRRQLIEAGIEPDEAPVREKTLTKAQLKELRETE